MYILYFDKLRNASIVQILTACLSCH